MRLERVDITGFKSFGDKAEITFHRGVTAVVGPNGCGKSNVADAIGWVLGEQSAKSLRGKRMEDLIFNGTESRQPQSLAEVNLHVSNVVLPRATSKSKKSTDALRGEVLVTRRLNRSGESEYLLDGVPSRLRDVHDLFMGTGVGAKAYAIIEQGKIGLILSTKPTDRRFIIEEAAGITKYKSRRRSAELKLTAAQHNLMRINDIVYEINRQMNSLKRQAGKARRYHRFRDAMSHLEKVYFVKSAKQKDSQLSAVRLSLNSVLDEESRRITSLTVADSYLARTRLHEAELASNLADARESLHQLEMVVERVDQSAKRDRQQRVELASRRSQLKADKSAIEARRVPITDRLNARINEEIDLGQQLVALDQASEEQQEKLKEASVDLGVLESSIEKRRSDIVYRISKVAALHNFLQGVSSNEDAASEELVKLTAEKRDLETEFLRVKDLLSESTSEIDLERQNTQLLATERSDVHLEVDNLRQQVQVFDVEVASVKEEVSLLTARLDSLEELVAGRMYFGNGARILFEQGEVQGINIKGSLVDAIEVEERFELAVEAFLGEMLQAVCVIDERDVARAHLLLKKEKQGCRTSLFVESLLRETSTQQLTKVVASLRNKGILGIEGVLSEYIKFVSMPAPSLPDSIVVENLETALQCYRFEQVEYVTLNGEVVKPSGFVDMGLGGTSAGMLQSKREIRTLRISLESKGEELQLSSDERSKRREKLDKALGLTEKIREQQHVLEKKLVGLSHRHEQLQEEMIRINRKQDVLVLEQQRLESDKATLASKRIDLENTLRKEEDQKAVVEQGLDSMIEELSGYRVKAEDLRTRASDGASRLAALTERRDAVCTDIDRLKEGLVELDARLNANLGEQNNLTSRDENLIKGIAEADAELASSLEIQADKTLLARKLESDIAAISTLIDATDSALKMRRRELDEVREKRSEEEVKLAKEEAEIGHLNESFTNSHHMTINEAAILLNPVELLRDDLKLQEELVDLKDKLDAIGPVNPMAHEEFSELERRHGFITKQQTDLEESIKSTEIAIGRIDRTSRQRFKEAFDAINEEFSVTFRQLFGGGSASLQLVEEKDLLESGIDIIAQPPGKKLQNVLLLSGGEKAMTAIALLFAIFRYRPSPFCLLDEVDAPLDDANVGRFLSMVRELRETTQFIVITHNRKTMEMADHLYGITMAEPGVSKLVSVNFSTDDTANAETVVSTA